MASPCIADCSPGRAHGQNWMDYKSCHISISLHLSKYFKHQPDKGELGLVCYWRRNSVSLVKSSSWDRMYLKICHSSTAYWSVGQVGSVSLQPRLAPEIHIDLPQLCIYFLQLNLSLPGQYTWHVEKTGSKFLKMGSQNRRRQKPKLWLRIGKSTQANFSTTSQLCRKRASSRRFIDNDAILREHINHLIFTSLLLRKMFFIQTIKNSEEG